MRKGDMFKLTIVKDCLCERSHGSPKRFMAGEIYKGRYEISMMRNFHVCFYIYEVDDFVYFPRASVSWEELEEKGEA